MDFLNRTDVQEPLQRVFDLYVATKSPEALGLQNELRKARAAAKVLQKTIEQQNQKIDLLQNEVHSLKETKTENHRYKVEVEMTKKSNKRLNDRIEQQELQLEAFRQDKFFLRETIRNELSSQHESVMHAQRDEHVRYQDRLEQKNLKMEEELQQMQLIAANSTIKGSFCERVWRDHFSQHLKVDVEDMGKTPCSMDIKIAITNDIDVYVDTKDYKATLPSKEVEKFERDRSCLRQKSDKALGFVLITKNAISNSTAATLVSSNLYKFKNFGDAYIVTNNDTAAVFQALFLIAQNHQNNGIAIEREEAACDDSLPEFNEILRRFEPFVSNHNESVKAVEAAIKSHKLKQDIDAESVVNLFNSTNINGLENASLIKTLSSNTKKRKR